MLYEDRQSKMQWAKNRAFELLDSGSKQTEVLTSFASDMKTIGLLDEVLEKLIDFLSLRVKNYPMENSDLKQFINRF